MNLHTIAPARKHGDVPLWTMAEYLGANEHIYGRIRDTWVQNETLFALWEPENPKHPRYVIHLHERAHRPESAHELIGSSWGIWEIHTLTSDLTPANPRRR